MKYSGRLETVLKLQADWTVLCRSSHSQRMWGRQPGTMLVAQGSHSLSGCLAKGGKGIFLFF